MDELKLESAGRVEKVRKALTPPLGTRKGPDAPGADVSESFRSARSGLVQISADLERLRLHASSLVKGAHRTAK